MAYEQSDFAAKIGILPEGYLQLEWSEFMRALAKRVVSRHRALVEDGCEFVTQQSGTQAEDVADLCERLEEVGLLGLGYLRAAWMMDGDPYLPHQSGRVLHMFSDLVLAIRMVERTSGWQAQFGSDGLVAFCKDGLVARAMVCHGSGLMPAALIDEKLRDRREAMFPQGTAPSFGLVAGAVDGPSPETPANIAADTDPDDLVEGHRHFKTVSITDLRRNPSLLRRWMP